MSIIWVVSEEMETLASYGFLVETNVVSNHVCSIPAQDSLRLRRCLVEIMPHHSMLCMKGFRRAVHPPAHFTVASSVSSSALLMVYLATWHGMSFGNGVNMSFLKKNQRGNSAGRILRSRTSTMERVEKRGVLVVAVFFLTLFSETYTD